MKKSKPASEILTRESGSNDEESGGEGSVSTSESGSSIVSPPDGGWGWVVVFASLMVHIIADGVTYTFGIFYVEFLKYFGGGNGETAWIASILLGVTYCSGPITSSLTNRFGCRAATIAGSILASTGLALSVFAPNIATLYVTIGIMTGFGFGLMYLPAIVSVTSYFEKRRAFATGVAVCGSGLGTFIMAPLTEYLVEEYTWKGAILIIAGLVLNCSIFGALFRPVEQVYDEQQRSKRWEKESETEELSPERKKSIADSIVPSITVTGIDGKLSDVNSLLWTALRRSSTGYEMIDYDHRLAVSTPALTQVGLPDKLRSFGSHGSLVKSRDHRSHHHHHRHPPPMRRKDIFYSGSVHLLPQYSDNPTTYTQRVTKAREHRVKDSVYLCGCLPVSQEFHDALTEMLSVSILKDWLFIIFTISNFLTSLGFNVPYVYIKDRALKSGLEPGEASFLLSTMGIANTVGRVLLGYLSDKPWVNRLYIYNVSLIICGVATAMSSACNDYVSLMTYSCVFGMTAGAYVSLTSVILVDLLGLDKLTNAFGILLMFIGAASLIGPPIAGWLYDQMGSYDVGFWLAGTMIAFSGLILFVVPCYERWKNSNCIDSLGGLVEENTLLKPNLQKNGIIPCGEPTSHPKEHVYKCTTHNLPHVADDVEFLSGQDKLESQKDYIQEKK